MAQYTYCLNNPVRYVDPLGLAVTDWDREHLSASEIAAVEKATAEWVSANASGDQKGKEAAHDAAEAIREQYRTGTERGSDNKDGNTVGTPDVTKPPKNEPVDTSKLGDNERNILEEYAGIVNSYSDGDLLDLVSSYDSELVEKIYAVIGSLGAGGKARAAAMLRQQLIRDAANALVNWHSSNIVDPLSDEPMQYVAYDVGKSANKVEVNPLVEFNKLLDDNDKFYKINNINYKGAPHYNAEEIFAAIGGELFKKQENAEFMFTQVSYGGSIVTFKYDLSSIPKNGNKNTIPIMAYLIGKPSYSAIQIEAVYYDGDVYINVSQLQKFLEKYYPEEEEPISAAKVAANGALEKYMRGISPLIANKSANKSGDSYVDNLGDYYFETEDDAVYAFGYLYNTPDKTIQKSSGYVREFGALIVQGTNNYTIAAVVEGKWTHPNFDTSVKITDNINDLEKEKQKITAIIHTHPRTEGFSDPDYRLYNCNSVERLYVIGPSDQVWMSERINRNEHDAKWGDGESVGSYVKPDSSKLVVYYTKDVKHFKIDR
jgi:hypothetical protein